MRKDTMENRILQALDRQSTFINSQTNGINDLKISVAKIEEHLKTLNGNVARNVLNINKNEDNINKIKLQMAKWSGAIIVLVSLIQIGIKYLLK